MNSKIVELLVKNYNMYSKTVDLLFKGKNSRYKKTVKNLILIDPIKDIDSFRNEVAELPERGMLAWEGYGRQGLFYGQLQAIYNYAGVDFSRESLMDVPFLEHGVNPSVTPLPDFVIYLNPWFVFQSNYKKTQIHKVNPCKPVIAIGPYIHYADIIYEENEIERLKKKFKKTLLVFPFHTYEMSTVDYNEDAFVEFVMNDIARDYDTVLISAYWKDVNSEIYKKFEENGAVIVSSGFRGDPRFIHRLKTLLYISDAVCGNAFGSHIGYAIHMKKPYIHFSSNVNFKDSSVDGVYSANALDERLFRMFGLGNSDKEDFQEFYNYFWGGDQLVLTREEMRQLLALFRMINDRTRFCVKKYDAVINELIEQDSVLSEFQRRMLADGIKNSR